MTWQERAECANADLALFFPHGERGEIDYRPARAICERCEVIEECLDFAMSFERQSARSGMWGGTTPRQRDKRKAILAFCPICRVKFAPKPYERICSDDCRAIARARSTANSHRSKVA